MPTTKSIMCPNCATTLTIGVNCKHEDDLSLICGVCNKVVFPVNQIQENTIVRNTNYTNNISYMEPYG
jgi:RNase P subunit RPR2